MADLAKDEALLDIALNRIQRKQEVAHVSDDEALIDQHLGRAKDASALTAADLKIAREEKPETGTGEAFVAGIAEGGTLGFGAEARAMAETFFAFVDRTLTGRDAFGKERSANTLKDLRNSLEIFSQAKKQNEEQFQKMKEEHGGAFAGGEILGTVATAIVPAGAVGKGLQAARKAQKAVKAGKGVGKMTKVLARLGTLGEAAAVETVKRVAPKVGARGLVRARQVGRGVQAAATIGGAEEFVRGVGQAETDIAGKLAEGDVAGALRESGQAVVEGAKRVPMGVGVGTVAGGTLTAGGQALKALSKTDAMKAATGFVSDKIDDAVNKMREVAGGWALRAASGGGPIGKLGKQLADKPATIAKIGDDLLDDVIDPITTKKLAKRPVTALGTLKGTQDRLNLAIDEVQVSKDNLLAQLDEAGEALFARTQNPVAANQMMIPKKELIGRIKNDVINKLDSVAEETQIKALKSFVQRLDDTHPEDFISFKRLQQLRTNTDKNLVRDFTNPHGTRLAFAKTRDVMNKVMDDKADDILKTSNPQLLGSYRKVRQLQSSLLNAQNVVNERLAAKMRNSPVGLTDLIVGGAAGAAEEELVMRLTKGALTAAAFRVLKTQAPRISARSINTLTKFIKKNKGKLGKYSKALTASQEARGTPGMLGTHFLLFKEDPEYRDLIEQLSDDE
jgi:hypothetical protein